MERCYYVDTEAEWRIEVLSASCQVGDSKPVARQMQMYV